MKIDRRAFLKHAGVGGLATAAGAESAEAAPTDRVSNDWMGVLTDHTLCIGCRQCEWACKNVNDLPGQERPKEEFEKDKSVFKERRRTDADNFTVVNEYAPAKPEGKPVYVKNQCMHCFEPACASSCLVAAFRKTSEGAVVYNESVCIGCRYCMIACPFLIPAYSYDNPYSPAVRKCTMCYGRTSEGKLPGCVEVCPVAAMTFGKRSELLTLARERISEAPEKYVNHVYGEDEAGGACWLHIAPRPFEDIGFRADIGSTAYPELTKGFLSAVPLVLTIWPAALMGAYAFTRRREELARVEVAAGPERSGEKG